MEKPKDWIINRYNHYTRSEDPEAWEIVSKWTAYLQTLKSYHTQGEFVEGKEYKENVDFYVHKYCQAAMVCDENYTCPGCRIVAIPIVKEDVWEEALKAAHDYAEEKGNGFYTHKEYLSHQSKFLKGNYLIIKK